MDGKFLTVRAFHIARWLASMSGFAALCACGTFYQPQALAGIDCEPERCAELWQRAQVWLATNGSYRIQLVTDSVIQTYGPDERDPTAVAYTVTRAISASGRGKITIRGSCAPTIYGCVTDPSKATNALYYALEKP